MVMGGSGRAVARRQLREDKAVAKMGARMWWRVEMRHQKRNNPNVFCRVFSEASLLPANLRVAQFGGIAASNT